VTIDYGKLAHNSLNSFVATVQKAIKSSDYDLILAGGDSGSIMAWITEVIYTELGKVAPQKIVLPSYRHSDDAETILFDNRIFKSDITLSITNPKRILFVDDEIGEGNTIRGVLSVLAEVITSRPKVTLIAENEDFDPSLVEGWEVEHLIPQMRAEGVFNAISYITPARFEDPVKLLLAPLIHNLNDKNVMATLLNLPIKQWNDGQPEFSWRYRDLCLEKLAGFAETQTEYQAYLKGLIHEQIAH
jgi:hypothetical protein